MKITTLTLTALFSCALTLPVLSGCSSNKNGTTVTRTDVTRDETTRGSYSGEPSTTTRVKTESVQSSEPQTVIVKEEEHNGIFGILGDIVSLPFRAVGALFRAIF